MVVRFSDYAVTVVCVSREVSQRFYREGLGATIDADRDPNLPTMVLRLGGLRLALLPNADAAKAADPGWVQQPNVALWLEVDDLDAAYAQAIAAGAQTLCPPDGERFEIADPDGNPIEVSRRADD